MIDLSQISMLSMGCIKQRYDDSDILNGINFQENNKRSSQSQCFLKKNPGHETHLLMIRIEEQTGAHLIRYMLLNGWGKN